MEKVCFKIGDKVRIIANTCGSCNHVGDIGIVAYVVSPTSIQVQVEGRKTDCNYHNPWELELYKEESYSHYLTEGGVEALNTIADKDYEFYLELEKLIKYLASTYSDKYESKDFNGFAAKDILLGKEGKSANMFTISKYLHRYSTNGFSKSDNIQDLYKSIHYHIFELQRKTKCK